MQRIELNVFFGCMFYFYSDDNMIMDSTCTDPKCV